MIQIENAQKAQFQNSNSLIFLWNGLNSSAFLNDLFSTFGEEMSSYHQDYIPHPLDPVGVK
jgi:hypothetical protein